MKSLRRAKTPIEPSILHTLLGLPENVIISHFEITNDPSCIWVHLLSDQFNEVVPNDESPVISRLILKGSP